MKLVALTFLTFVPLIANSAQTIDMNKSVTRISTYDSSAVVFFTPSQANGQNCTDPRTDAVKIDLTVESGSKMLSTALAAATAGKKIGFGLNGCLEGNLPKVYRVDVGF